MFLRARNFLFIFFLPMAAFAQDVSFSEFLNSAWRASPVVKGEALQNDASDQFVSSARGKYFPHVSLQALDTTGFPASNSGLQIGGLMGSPFRSGLAGGVVVEQTIYDFGRIGSLLENAKAEKSLNQARLAEDKFRYLITAGNIYLACAKAKSLQKTDEELMSWAKLNLKETARFTKTGQRSIVDNSLVQTEVNRLALELDQLQKFQTTLTEQMKLFGVKGSCKHLSDTWAVQVPSELKVEEPTVLIAKARMEISRANYEQAKDAQLPSIKAMGSAGDMEKERLLPKKENYAAGIGVSFPVWNGGEDAHRESAYKSQTDYQNENLKTAQLEFASKLKGLQDEYARNKEALVVVQKDLETVEKTIRLASRRYRSLEGPLIDVREAFKQLREMNIERLQIMSLLGGNALQLGLLRQTGAQNERL